jgi:predicted RNA binding protein YcfA (HicA-like mRNA interferase family)
MPYTKLPPLNGKQLIRLLEKDGWVGCGRTRHGVALVKQTGNKKVITIVPDKKAELPDGTLSNILGVKQTGIGKAGLLDLVNKYGL